MWLGVQPHMRALVEKRGIEVVPQSGGQSGEFRAQGSLRKVIEALAKVVTSFEGGEIQTGVAVRKIEQTDQHEVTVNLGSGETVFGRHVLLALAPAKVQESIPISGPEVAAYLDSEMLRRMKEQPVWMGPCGKLALLYRSKFWSDPDVLFRGLPVRPFIQQAGFAGMQSYDGGMTTDGRNLHAIVVFVVSAHQDTPNPLQLAAVVAEQIAQETGAPREEVMNFEATELKFWRSDELIQTDSGRCTQNFPQHPSEIRGLNRDVAGRRVWFANSEASVSNPGILEGAVENSKKVAMLVWKKLQADGV
eukprot:gb/GFBE01010111.1/.p1 GENE.gb/GFBE01010111.1/~~gb/GFBE01010111.1/.p1  ORF type:complete len:305 (+),score=47.57 gb/GFBE01010111.1/:1-915(+)